MAMRKSITISLTAWSSKVPKQYDLLCGTWKHCHIDKQNVKYILWDTYFCPISIKIEN